MKDDIIEKRKLTETPIVDNKDLVNQTSRTKRQDRVCFVITRKKQSSWIDDLDTQEKMNRLERVFH